MLRNALSFMVSNNLLELSWQLFIWTSLGLLAGILSGIGVFRFIRSRGGYRLEAKGARGWRALVCVLDIGVLTIAGAYIGLFEGLWLGIEDTAGKSPLVQALNAKAGRVEALFLAGVYHASLFVKHDPGVTPEEAARRLDERLDAFASGSEEIPVREFQRQVDAAGREVIDRVVGLVEHKAMTWMPALKGTLGQRLLRKGLDELGRALLQEKARQGLRHVRLDVHLDRVLSTLPAEAARSGSPAMLSFQELSDSFAREGLIPWLLDLVRSLVRAQQLGALLLAFLALLLPVAGFRIARASRESASVGAPG